MGTAFRRGLSGQRFPPALPRATRKPPALHLPSHQLKDTDPRCLLPPSAPQCLSLALVSLSLAFHHGSASLPQLQRIHWVFRVQIIPEADDPCVLMMVACRQVMTPDTTSGPDPGPVMKTIHRSASSRELSQQEVAPSSLSGKSVAPRLGSLRW